MSNDAFYFGVLPILTKAAATELVQLKWDASLLGQPVHLLSPLVASTYLLVGMAKVDFGEHQRFTLLWAVGTTMVMLITGIVVGLFNIRCKNSRRNKILYCFIMKNKKITSLGSPNTSIY